MPVLHTVGLKCMLAASHNAPGESRWEYWWDRHTDGRQTVTVCYAFHWTQPA